MPRMEVLFMGSIAIWSIEEIQKYYFEEIVLKLLGIRYQKHLVERYAGNIPYFQ